MGEDKEVMRQGSEYSEEEPEIMDSVAPKIPKKLLYGVLGVVAVGILIILVVSLGHKTPKASPATAEDPNLLQQILVNTNYTADEVKQLRAAGYTGDEIEKYQTDQADVKYLLDEAKKQKEEYLKKLYIELNGKVQNSASPEFKELLNKTWLGGKALDVSNKDIFTYETVTMKEVVDYIKLPARGTQLFIRVTLDNGEYAFMEVHPSRWCEMKDVGNIVVTYDQVKFGNETFVLNIVEVPV